MAAKRKITIKKKAEKIETPIEEVEKAVETVVEEEMHVEEVAKPRKVRDRVAGTI